MTRPLWFLKWVTAVLALALLQGQSCTPSPGPGDDDCTELSGTISENTTLAAGCYEVTQDLTVGPGATLTISPGVTLRFAEDVEMTVGPDGVLVALGTAEEPIVLTGMEQTRGYWGGLRFYDFDAEDDSEVNNQLGYVTIEYGGASYNANLSVDYNGGVSVNNCTLRHSSNYGFSFSDDRAVISAFANNTVTDNASGAGWLSATHVQYLEDSSTFIGNDNDVVVIGGGTVNENQTWPAIDVPYYVDTSAGLNIAADLVISPGATLMFADANERMDVTGSLYAVGTADQPITLTAADAVPGGWGGLRFYDFDAEDDSEEHNQLGYVTIEYGGGYHDANLSVGYDGGVGVNNCTLRHSSNYGFSFSDDRVIISAFANNTVTDNASGAGWLFATHIQYLEDSSTFIGNDNDVVVIGGGTVNESQTWPAIDVPYYVDTSAGLNIAADLVISPGATFVFADANERMDVTGSLYAVGTADQPITLTAADAVPGGWGGLRIYNADSENNQLEYVTISYGGGYHNANLHLNGSPSELTQASVSNCTFSDSAGWGIYWVPEYVTVDGDLTADNSFSNNATGSVGTP